MSFQRLGVKAFIAVHFKGKEPGQRKQNQAMFTNDWYGNQVKGRTLGL